MAGYTAVDDNVKCVSDPVWTLWWTDHSEAQRMANLGLDLRHAHTLDMHAKHVFSTVPAPSGVRRSHGATSSTFRGQQLLSMVQGRRLEVASLCAIHDQEGGAVPDGSVRQLELMRACMHNDAREK